MSLSEIALRHLARRDILSLVSLVLTSFRRFPLFDFLYSPLRSDINNAQDTIFFWNLRLRKALLDPSAMLIVAEVPPERLPNTLGDDPTAIDRDSWEMWDWLQSQSKPRFNSGFGRNSIVGFALWRRVGADAPQNNRCISLPGRLEQIIIDIQLWFYGRFYKRKDVHAERYAAYLTSEDVLQEKYHTGSFLYLDNLCVDFRLHGSGIGRKLLEFGQEYARNENLPIRTETTENNVEFYKKVDFYSIGIWEVQAPAGTSPMALTVLEWKDENN